MLDDLAKLTPDLKSLGWTDDHTAWAEGWKQQNEDEAQDRAIDRAEDDETKWGRVGRVSRGYCVVFTGGDAVLAVSGSIRTRTDVAPATGDYVIVASNDEDGTHIAAIAPRTTALARRAPGRVPEAQVLAANVDSVLVMHGLDQELNLRRIERQLVVASDSGAKPVILLTKTDSVDNAEETVAEVRKAFPGVDIVATSVITGEGIADLEGHIPAGKTIAMLGLSGIGKSTIVNLLSGGQVQRTNEVRAADSKGRHTTVTRDLIPIPGHGLIIDTPGVREIGLWQAHEGLRLTFPVLATATESCRFADCAHNQEPDCGVQAAIAAGTTTSAKFDHWNELQAELELQDSQLEEFERRSESRDRADAERKRDGERKNTKTRRNSSQKKRR